MDNKDGSKRVPLGTFGGSAPPDPPPEARSTDEQPDARQALDAGGLPAAEPHTGRRQPSFPDTLRGRPSAAPAEATGSEARRPTGAWSTPPEEEASRPSVQSIPPPMPVGEKSEEFDVERSRAVTPDYHAHLAQRRAAPERAPDASVDDARRPDDAGHKSAPGVVPSSLLPTLPPPAAGQGFALDAQARWGLALLATMFLVGFGGWWLTSGSYRDAGPTPAKAAPAAEAAEAATAPGVSAPPATTLSGAPSPVAETKPGIAAADGAAPLRATPSRDDVRVALSTLQAAFVDCAHGRKGIAHLDLTIAGTGTVTNVTVGGAFASTPQAACIARVARTAQFARFKKPRYRIVYPITL